MNERQTIYALSSGGLPSGVAVIRLSGPRVRFVLETLCRGVPEPRVATLRRLSDPGDGSILDQALVLWFPGPASFTGEDVAELQLHGGRAVVAAVLRALASFDGLAAAEPGGFTRRAFEAGRLDLTEVEGLGDLVTAETEAQRRQALRQMGGALGRLYSDWAARLTRARAMIEAEFDFADEEDVPGGISDSIWEDVIRIRDEIRHHLDDGRRGERLRSGLQVVLLGPPNAGKSSLLNALAQRDAAIVTEEAGTTRDVIEVHLDLGGYPLTLVDTAGVREKGAGAIEREGIRRALLRAEGADLVLWMNDSAAGPMPVPDVLARSGVPVWPVMSKADRLDNLDSCAQRSGDAEEGAPLAISVRSAEGTAGLIAALERFASRAMGRGEDVLLTQARHREGLVACLAGLDRALENVRSPLELRSEELRGAAAGLGRIVGTSGVEDLLDVIFRDFCIGK
ncbi:tRNA uridine-5-carboxymethylaminomethyl(34) synthesis GTPase MnmE [Breoghania sp. L-A4]|nr:tRNA uridine-5-carboxymethylaminomethyl(34) synthesis GTPase MnmE [Breoghania sp. L-A4]